MAEFHNTSQPAHSNNWVSNVIRRKQSIDVLKDTLGFTPKVNLNVGVIASGD